MAFLELLENSLASSEFASVKIQSKTKQSNVLDMRELTVASFIPLLPYRSLPSLLTFM